MSDAAIMPDATTEAPATPEATQATTKTVPFTFPKRWSWSTAITVQIDASLSAAADKTKLGAALRVVLDLHAKWRRGEEGGSRAVLRDADLRDAVLRDADLSGADLSGAVLRGAVLSGADLRDAVLSGADLRDAVLSDAVLRGAVLRGAVLSGADLRDAVLSGAVLSRADLRDAVLRDGIKINMTPIQVTNLRWPVTAASWRWMGVLPWSSGGPGRNRS
ncbi:pentapeptide repeat-containing protein [Azospirillum argentinense]|uniref:pentapeptide repeat-containing protein n=1 Tax=Azospirillum argentinense TaxID=2970906 RepID=UPI001586CC1A|nr:pentapeptide repeat-containing protein [Azospirillum argentinense]